MGILCDIMLICLPMPLVRWLHVSLKDKIALAVVFGLAGFVTIVSGIRYIYLHNIQDLTGRRAVNLVLTTAVESKSVKVCSEKVI